MAKTINELRTEATPPPVKGIVKRVIEQLPEIDEFDILGPIPSLSPIQRDSLRLRLWATSYY